MDISKLRNITNNYQDVRLLSLHRWEQAGEFVECDRGGPYVVGQEGYDPADLTSTPGEFVLGKCGKWLPVSAFFALPIEERRAQFIFSTASEVMKLLESLPGKVVILRPGESFLQKDAPQDDLNTAVIHAKSEASENDALA